jgi:hypothetical protein
LAFFVFVSLLTGYAYLLDPSNKKALSYPHHKNRYKNARIYASGCSTRKRRSTE